jgi:hypothetical protein
MKTELRSCAISFILRRHGHRSRTMTFVMQRSTFGQDEVTATGGVFNQPFCTVDGLKPSDFPGAITTLSPGQALLKQWAPSIPDPVGPAGPTNIKITPASVSRCCGMGLGRVHEYLERAVAAGIGWPLPEGLGEEELEARLFGNQPVQAERCDSGTLLRELAYGQKSHT